jgi:hypothetical protein
MTNLILKNYLIDRYNLRPMLELTKWKPLAGVNVIKLNFPIFGLKDSGVNYAEKSRITFATGLHFTGRLLTQLWGHNSYLLP